jgi:GNAT superfamily N-acetyltransferase
VSAYVGPILLTPAHSTTNFDCGKPALNRWLQRQALSNQSMGTTRTWVVLGPDQTIIAFYSSATASILKSTATGRLAHHQPEQIPAILLARLAVDEKHQHGGIGAALLKHCIMKAMEVSESVGVRLLLVHAKDEEAQAFYRRYEFEPSPIDEFTLMMPIPAGLA